MFTRMFYADTDFPFDKKGRGSPREMESSRVGATEKWMPRRRNDMNIVMNHSEFRGESEHKGDGNRVILTAARRQGEGQGPAD